MNKEQIAELMYQALETEQGGIQIYETAVRCAVNEDLKEEWEKYLEQTENHVRDRARPLRDLRPRSRDGDAGPAGRSPHRRVPR